MGLFTIRIDDQLNVDLIDEVQSHGFQCCLNASTITQEMLERIYEHDHQRQLIYCHNYYPRPDTGLSRSFIDNKINLFMSTINMLKYMPLFQVQN